MPEQRLAVKRATMSDDYLSSFNLPHFNLVTDSISRFTQVNTDICVEIKVFFFRRLDWRRCEGRRLSWTWLSSPPGSTAWPAPCRSRWWAGAG